MGLDATECLAFEDSGIGLESATKAGLKTVVTVNDYTRNDGLHDAAIVLDQLGEPDSPVTVLSGKQPTPGACVDVSFLKRLFLA
jgi:beta-phosphoglucomutase-like phosphatase (HAD superfamily)